MPAARILFVDDDFTILETLQKILTIHGYEAKTASNVTAAINLITSEKFDVLIADLNMGHAADGFTIVHTMRRVNPACINFLLTGYPAFETALQALREQVDDYLTKPADIPKLLDSIQRKLKEHVPNQVERPTQRLSAILRDNIETIKSRMLVNMKAHPELVVLPLTDEQRVDGFLAMLQEIAKHLDSEMPNDTNEKLIQLARTRGRERLAEGYPLPLLSECERIVTQVINNVLYENLLAVNLSHLLLDLNKLTDAMLMQNRHSLEGYLEAERERR